MELYEHQKKAVEKLHNGAILVANVGLGKSITALSYYVTKEEKNAPKKDLYIITTARKRDDLSWEEECGRFGLSTNPELCKYDVKVTIDSWNNIEKYVNTTNAFFIFDEQRAVGSGKWAKTFVKIARKNRWIMLTATPGDTWMDYIPVFMANNLYKTKGEFTRRHVVFNPYTRWPKVERYLEVEHLSRLRRSITVIMDYNKPAEVHTETVIIPYDEEAYKALGKTRWNPEKNRPIRTASELCSLWRKECGRNEQRLDELLKVIRKRKKIVIFYNYDWELEKLRGFLESQKIAYAEWNGHNHQEIPSNDIWCYLVQYDAGAEGWNCIESDTIVFFSLNYSFKKITQAAGRIDRLNTPFKHLYYYYFRTSAPIDLAIERCRNRKKKFNEKSFIEEIEMEELKYGT